MAVRDGSWISIGRRSRRSGSTRSPARSRAPGSRRRTGLRSASSLSRFADRVLRSRWRQRPAGGSWSRSSSGSVLRCTLAEAAEASALKGKKKRAKTDFADARHLRELLLIGRIPESWIPPAHILDLRARVRTRHLLSHQRTEWQQRMHAVLYHHGVPQRRDLLNRANREWLAEVALPAAAREQLEIALHVIDAIEQRLIPFDRSCTRIAKSQPGCRTLMHEIYGVGALTSVTILAELGDVRRFSELP